MGAPRMLPGERMEATLRPHPVAWLGRYLLAGFPLLWGLFLAFLFRTDWWMDAERGAWYQVWTFLYGNAVAAHVYTVAGLAVAGAIVSVATIRWRRFFLYVAVGLAAVAVTLATRSDPEAVLPVLLAVASLPLLGLAEVDRRSHRYFLTNLRVVFQGGVLVQKERQLKYESVTDLDGTQGALGAMFDYGTLIPVTQSGFGLGNDTSQAGLAVGGGGEKAGLFGGAAVTAGGGKEVATGRARSFHQLTGVKPYKDTKYLLERLVQEATSTPYLREQVELQREMVDALRGMRGGQDPAGSDRDDD